MVMGVGLQATAYGELVIGQYNTTDPEADPATGDPASWQATDYAWLRSHRQRYGKVTAYDRLSQLHKSIPNPTT